MGSLYDFLLCSVVHKVPPIVISQKQDDFGGKIWTGSLDKLSAQFPIIARLRRRDKYYFWHLYHS